LPRAQVVTDVCVCATDTAHLGRYARVMSRDVSVRELHEHTAEVLRRVESGEHVRVVRNGDPIVELAPVTEDAADENGPQTWVPGEVLLELPLFDAAMRDDIAAVYDRLDGC
jgi:prevent-host-death family protein